MGHLLRTLWQSDSKPSMVLDHPEEKSYLLKEGEVQAPKPYGEVKNRIVCAANKLPDGTVLPGVRHWDSVMHRIADKLPDNARNSDIVEREVQGFLDRFGVFHTREEAWKIAFDAGQIIRRCGNDNGKLWSENLY